MARYILIPLLILAFASPAFAASAEKKREKILDMRKEVLTELYKTKPQARRQVAQSAGYAVFSNVGVNVVLFSAGGGSGVAHDNGSGTDIFMNMASAGVGIGLGVKDFRAVFIFDTRNAFSDFIEHGWDFSGQADAAAKADDKGAAGAGAGTVVPGVTLYQLTKSGLALQATLQGTKYWKSDKLN